MRKVKLNLSVFLAGVALAGSTFSAGAASPAVAEPAAAVAASAPAPTAPVSTDAASAPAQIAPAAAETASTAASISPVAADAANAEQKAPVLSEEEGLALLKQSNCLLCHSVQKKIVGPAYKDVAAKYRGQADAEAKLVAKVTKGGKGVWGSAAMPPQTAKPEDIRSLVRFVLALK